MWIDPLSLRLFRGASVNPDVFQPVVLMYHSIAPGSGIPKSRWAVSEKRFRDQLMLLKREGWSTCRATDLLAPGQQSPRTVAITFDDGYADNFECGFSHLVEAGMRATWFVVSCDVGSLSTWKDHDAPQRLMLSAGQLNEMARAGMEIGAHTRSHARLTSLARDEVREEVAGSRQDLEALLGHQVSSFAYPYGLHDEITVEEAKRAGFSIAFTTDTGRYVPGNPFRVRRVAIFGNDSLSVFARKLAFADTDVRWGKMTRYVVSRIGDRLFSRQR